MYDFIKTLFTSVDKFDSKFNKDYTYYNQFTFISDIELDDNVTENQIVNDKKTKELKTSPEIKAAEMEVKKYEDALNEIDYSSQKFEVTDSEQKSSNYTIVKSRIAESLKSPEIKIDWRVYTKNPQKPLIRDLIVEGLSLAKTQKEEFASILNSNNDDINSLIKKLQEFIVN